VAFLSVYERIERMQEKDPDIAYGGDFLINLKSGGNIPSEGYAPAKRRLRIMTNPDDE
jgi:hypothetical protein